MAFKLNLANRHVWLRQKSICLFSSPNSSQGWGKVILVKSIPANNCRMNRIRKSPFWKQLIQACGWGALQGSCTSQPANRITLGNLERGNSIERIGQKVFLGAARTKERRKEMEEAWRDIVVYITQDLTLGCTCCCVVENAMIAGSNCANSVRAGTSSISVASCYSILLLLLWPSPEPESRKNILPVDCLPVSWYCLPWAERRWKVPSKGAWECGVQTASLYNS